MNLADLDAREPTETRHDVQRSAHLLLAIDTLTAAWNGCFDDDDFPDALRQTAERLQTLATTFLQSTKPPTNKPKLAWQCPRCEHKTNEPHCPKCDYHFGDGLNG